MTKQLRPPADEQKVAEARSLRARNRVVATVLYSRAQAGLVPDPPPPSAARKVFVVGCPRSGTTWVRDIYGRHPLAITGPEMNLYRQVLEPLLDPDLGVLRRWTKVLHLDDRDRQRGSGVHLHRWVDRDTFLRLATRAMASSAGAEEAAAEQLVAEIYHEVLTHRGATADHVFVEKAPHQTGHSRRLLRQFAEAKVVEVVRDGRDVCVSMDKYKARWVPRDRRSQITKWVESVELGLALRGDPDVAGRVLLVRYEDLKANPGAEIVRLLDFAGLAHTPELVERIVKTTDFSAYRVTGDGYLHRKGIVGDWANSFSDEDQALFREMAGDLFERVGYRY